jgi:hypothetical protein
MQLSCCQVIPALVGGVVLLFSRSVFAIELNLYANA